jgi:L-ascorbate metabolism protein UlaG (beta-lactamase superfamily)
MTRNARIPLALVCLVLLAALVAPAPRQAAPSFDVTYLANAGFLVQAGKVSFLIDALFRDGVAGYPRVPAAALEQAETGRAPYDVKFVLATHAHADHFDAASVGRHLVENSSAIFISGEEAIFQLEGSFADFARIGARVRGMMPLPGAAMKEMVAGVELRMLRLEHTPSHMGFLVVVEKRKLLHVGDADATAANFAPYNLAAEKIDVAFVPYWYLLDDAGIAVVRQHIAAKRLAVMHIPTENPGDERLREHLETHGGRAAMIEKMRAAFPNAVFFTEPMQTAKF